ncbi:hypothetical protein D5R81_12430 [Parashewanella spongiae]|uniref:Lipoprotein n=1 Tax=Parashewanella spongiae TaxID=342950 RepID=A0A3A6U7H1_9GAMM|nr:hypothetical protein [Parashewanella spongiae]MCL1076657.1 hypothetical protein [Parashewanella spongiae]RJY12417.1 hypothetical protein D5R81_12430 [Parashewanella spongiae]
MNKAYSNFLVLVLLSALTVGCTSSQAQKSLGDFAKGAQESHQSRNQKASSRHQDTSPNSEDAANGILNMLFQGLVSLFSSDDN